MDFVALTASLPACSPKTFFYRLDLDGISLDCGCAVGVNVVYLMRMQPTVCQRRGDGTSLSAAVRPGYMGPVTGVAITANLRINSCATGESMFPILNHQSGATFCKGEPGAVRGKWAAGTISRCRISFR